MEPDLLRIFPVEGVDDDGIDSDLGAFVRNGFVVYRGIYQPADVDAAREEIIAGFERLKARYRAGGLAADSWRWTTTLLNRFMAGSRSRRLHRSARLRAVLRRYLGPDVVALNHPCLYIIDPDFPEISTNQPPHTDAWVGNHVNSIQVNSFLTAADDDNSLVVYPGSHLLGYLPSRARALDPSVELPMAPLTLRHIQAGDVLIFHPLLLHATAEGKSAHLRLMIGDRYTSSETAFSSQERALGYRSVSVGPLNHVLRLIGNDHLAPYRLLDHPAWISPVLQEVYGLLNDGSAPNPYDEIEAVLDAPE